MADWQSYAQPGAPVPAVPTPQDITNLAASRPQAYQPTPDEAAAMSGDLSAIAAAKQPSSQAAPAWQAYPAAPAQENTAPTASDLAAIAAKKQPSSGANVFDQFDNPGGSAPSVPPPSQTPPSAVGAVNDLVNNVGTGLYKGAADIAAIPHTAAQIGDVLEDKAAEVSPPTPQTKASAPAFAMDPYSEFSDLAAQWAKKYFPSAQGIKDFIFQPGGVPEYKPTTAAGKIVQSSAEAVPAALGFGPAGAGLAAVGGGTGEIGAEAFPDHPELARFIGSLAGPVSAVSITRSLAPVANMMRMKFGNVDQNALRLLATRIANDKEGGGLGAQDILDAFQQNPGSGLTIADMSPGAKGAAERIANEPGPGGRLINKTLNDRDVQTGQVLSNAIDAGISDGGNAFDTAQALDASRRATSQPLYEQSFQGGSTAPLESQFRASLQAATGAKGQIAKQIAQIERENPGALAARGAAGASVRERYMALHQQLEQAEADRVATLQAFQKAQADGTMNAPGAVWNPRIQQFLNDPVMKGGLSRGLQIQRLEALAEEKTFNPTEYAITGTDESGAPIVSGVPNMRLLDAAKKGLDAIIQDERNAVTGRLTEYGRAVDMVRRSFLKELDKINPTYARARAAYSGPSRSMDALRDGQSIFTKTPKEIAADLEGLTASDREFYRLGAADALKTRIAKTGMGGNEAKEIIGSQWARERIRPLFDSDEAYQRFIKTAENENTKFTTKRDVTGNSATFRRAAEAKAVEGEHGGGLIGSGLTAAIGAHFGEEGLAMAGGMNFLRQLASKLRGVGAGPNPKVDLALAKMLMQTDPETLSSVLSRAEAYSSKRGAIPYSAIPTAAIPQARISVARQLMAPDQSTSP